MIEVLNKQPGLVNQFLNHTEPFMWADETFTLARFVPYNFSPANIPNSIAWFDEYFNVDIPVPNYPNNAESFPNLNCGK